MTTGKRLRPATRMALYMVSALLLGGAFPSAVRAEDPATEVEDLRREVRELRQRDEENRARMADLERMMQQMRREIGVAVAPLPAPAVAADALDAALAAAPPPAPSTLSIGGSPAGSTGTDLFSVPIGTSGATARLMDMSVVTLAAGGGSSVGNSEVGQLQLGGHDPNKNGFTLQQGELSISGAVDPYFSGELHVVGMPGGVELEEAFLTTTSLPYGLQVEAGYSLTEFGLINPKHAHAWEWIDQPVINSRLFGGEGTRAPGARLS